MAGDMKARIKMTKSMVMEPIIGLTEGNMKGNGKKESNMEKENIIWRMGAIDSEFGKMENAQNGLKNKNVGVI